MGSGPSSPSSLPCTSSGPSGREAQFEGEQDPDLVVVEAVLVTLQPLIVSHLVAQDAVGCPNDEVQDTEQEDAVDVVQLSDVCDDWGSSGPLDSGFGPGVGMFPGPMVIVGHGTLGTGGGTGGG